METLPVGPAPWSTLPLFCPSPIPLLSPHLHPIHSIPAPLPEGIDRLQRAMLAAALLSLVLFSVPGHKEFRFLFHLHFLCLPSAAVGAVALCVGAWARGRVGA